MNRPTPRDASRSSRLALLLLAAAVLTAPGCNYLGYGASLLAGDTRTKKVKVESQYNKLAGKSVAVIAAADEYTLFAYPGSPQAVCRAVTKQLAADYKDLKLTDPQQVARFQKANPYWTTLTNRQLFETFKVDRIIYIDLTEYTTHEPGNKHIWKGSIVANVSVAEADAEEPNNFAFHTVVSAVFPKDRPVGITESDDQTMQLGMLREFAIKVAYLFRNHEEFVPR